MRCKALLHITIALMSCWVHAQSILFINEDQQPIAQVKVLITDVNDQLVGIAYSNVDGVLGFSFKPSVGYNLKATHSSYQTSEFTVKLQENESKKIALKKLAVSLDEILIEAKKSIRKNGDTTFIDIKKFALPTDKNLRQVVSRVPGMKVAKNGEISYKNKKITNLLINGRKLFDYDYTTAIDFINSNKIVELQVIEQYNDHQGFSKAQRNTHAIDVKFVDSEVFTGQLGVGLGNEELKRFEYGHVWSNKHLTNYSNSTYNNLGKIQYRVTTNSRPRKMIEFYKLINALRHSSSLNNVYGNFSDHFEVNANTNIPLNDDKSPLIVKLAHQSASSELMSNARYTLFDELANITREESINNQYNSDAYSVLLSNKVQTDKWYVNNEFFLSTGSIERLSNNLLNDISIMEDQKEKQNQLLLNSSLQIKGPRQQLHDFDISIGVHHQDYDHYSVGFNEFDQKIRSYSYAVNADYQYDVFNHEKFKIHLKTGIDYLHSDYETSITGDFLNSFDAIERSNLWVNKLTGVYSPSKKLLLHLSINNTNSYHDNQQISNVVNSRLLYPDVQVVAIIKGVKNQLNYSNSISRLTHRVSNSSRLYNGNTYSETYNITNPFVNVHDVNYRITWGDIIDRWDAFISYKNQDAILINDTSYTSDATTLNFFNESLNEDQWQAQLARDVLFLRKFRLKVSLGHMVIRSFQSSSGDLDSFDNKITNADVIISKRLGKKWFFKSNTMLSYSSYRFGNSFSSDLFNWSTSLDFEYAHKNATMDISYNLNDFGASDYVHFLNAKWDYHIEKWSSSLSINAINLFNVSSLESKNITAQSSFVSSLILPERRVLISWRYYF